MCQPLWGISEMKRKKCAIIVGAGAVKNAWAPVLRALQPLHDFPLTSDGANSFLARLVYLLRWYSTDKSAHGRTQFERHMEFLAEVRKSIARELIIAQKNSEITSRNELKLILNRFVIPYSKEFMLVSTNWDTVINQDVFNHLNQNYHCHLIPLHVHGSIDNPELMYLPTEMTKEPYRTPAEEQLIGGMHGSIWRGLEQASRVVVYGLSISPLDAELAQTLAAGWSNSVLKEILIVDPNHQEISHRVNLLLDRKRDICVKGFHPEKIGIEYDYSVIRHKTNKSIQPTR